jgi:uncharacterized membrane protein
MGPNRLEAFSDGVLAIIITIMVLELHVPHEATAAALLPLLPTLFCYVLSFVYVGIYWNNHHHLLHACRRVTAGILWANLLLLFWLSLIPFMTAWMGENHFASLPTQLYGALMLMAAISYTILQQAILAAQPEDLALRRAFGRDRKGKISLALYATAVALATRWPLAATGVYVVVALIWLIPDRRIERALKSDDKHVASH